MRRSRCRGLGRQMHAPETSDHQRSSGVGAIGGPADAAGKRHRPSKVLRCRGSAIQLFSRSDSVTQQHACRRSAVSAAGSSEILGGVGGATGATREPTSTRSPPATGRNRSSRTTRSKTMDPASIEREAVTRVQQVGVQDRSARTTLGRTAAATPTRAWQAMVPELRPFTADIGSSVPDLPGRGLVKDIADGVAAREFQAYYTPDPIKAHQASDLGALAAAAPGLDLSRNSVLKSVVNAKGALPQR